MARMTIGVWVGRPDGAPVPGLVGRATAAPILFDAFARTGHPPTPLPRAPKGALFAASASCRRRCSISAPRQAPARRATPPRIMFPPNGARLELAAIRQPDPIALKIAGGARPLTVLVNGVPLAANAGRRTLFFQPDGPGFVRLTVMDARGAHRQRHGAAAIASNDSRQASAAIGSAPNAANSILMVRSETMSHGHR